MINRYSQYQQAFARSSPRISLNSFPIETFPKSMDWFKGKFYRKPQNFTATSVFSPGFVPPTIAKSISQGIYADTEAMMNEVFELNPVQGISYKTSQDGQDMGTFQRWDFFPWKWKDVLKQIETVWLNMAFVVSFGGDKSPK